MALEYKDVMVKVGNAVAKTAENPEGEVSRMYKQLVKESVTADDLLVLMQEASSLKTLINNWWYGQDLKAKADVRAEIMKGLPVSMDKTIDKQIKTLMAVRAANGKPISEEAARQKVMAMFADE